MKTFRYFLFLCFLIVLTSCSEDTFVPQSEVIPTTENGFVDYISMTVPDIEIDDATTRSKFVDEVTELKFVWQEDDAIGVVPMSGHPLSFPIHAENAQKNTALFDGGQWALRTDAKYSAFFPYKKDYCEKDAKSITIDYTGQAQGNYTDYDFMASGATQPKDGAVKFTMQRLSAILKIRTVITAGNHVQYFSLTASDPVFGVKGTLDLSGTEPVYTPTVMSKSINTQLVMDKEVTSNEEFFTIYLMIPPVDLSGKDLTLSINSNSGDAMQAVFEGKNFEAGKAYYIYAGYGQDPYITNSNLIEAAGLSDLVTSLGVNVNLNNKRILEVTTIDVGNKNDPTVCDEIGFFRNLKNLYCQNNQLTFLDVSNNPALEYLQCFSNDLTSLVVINNPKLTRLRCDDNRLTFLDVSNNTELTELICFSNQLTSLDVSNNPALTYLKCYSNQLTSLDVSSCTALRLLECYTNQLASLNVSNNLMLGDLRCHYNQLTSLDVSNNTLLTHLYCYFNHLTSLDVSKCPIYWQLLQCGHQTIKSTGEITYIKVTGNDIMEEYFLNEGTIPNSSNPLFDENCYVEYEGVKFPVESSDN